MPHISIQRLRGFKDLLGEEAALFSWVENVAREVFGLFDFQEIRVPTLEEKALFSRALGTDTDVVQKEMYEFKDRSDVLVAMRPEGTAGVVRAYLENNLDKTQGLARLFYMGPMFRSERPQAGRLRQFHQIGVEELGTSSPHADAEVILSLMMFLDRLGVTKTTLKLNNLGTPDERKILKDKLTRSLKPKIGAFCEDCKKRFDRNVFRLLDCKVSGCRTQVRDIDWIRAGQPLLTSDVSKESAAHFDAVCHALESARVKFEIDPLMVRGLDYYTKTVFELTHPDLGSQDALAAGGRYDELIQSFGGAPAGAVGFALGVERLLLCVSFKPHSAKVRPVTVVALGEECLSTAFSLLTSLRGLGLPAVMEFAPRSLKSQLRAAEKRGCRWVVLLGEEELKKKQFILKDMLAQDEKDKQVSYDLDGLIARFRKIHEEARASQPSTPDFENA